MDENQNIDLEASSKSLFINDYSSLIACWLNPSMAINDSVTA